MLLEKPAPHSPELRFVFETPGATERGSRITYFSTTLRSHLFRRSASGSGPRFCRVAPLRLSLHLWSDNAWSFPLIGSRPVLSVSPTIAGRSVPSHRGSSGPCRSGKLG